MIKKIKRKTVLILGLLFKRYPKLILNLNYDEYWEKKTWKLPKNLNSFQKKRFDFVLKNIDDSDRKSVV